MEERENIQKFVMESLALAHKIAVSELTLTTDLLKDLNAKSVTYFPLIAAIEDEYDLEIEYQEFRRKCRTVEDIITFIEEEID